MAEVLQLPLWEKVEQSFRKKVTR